MSKYPYSVKIVTAHNTLHYSVNSLRNPHTGVNTINKFKIIKRSAYCFEYDTSVQINLDDRKSHLLKITYV